MTDRVIGDRREMNDGIKPLEVLGRHIADVASPLFVAVGLRAEVTSVVPTNIETDDLMAGGLHEGNEYRADVATVAGH